jgi:pimeloyl-ACP methyl ester carboxylesterase
MNEHRFPWKMVAALAATALLVRRIDTARRLRPQARRRAALRPLHPAWHQFRDCRIFSRHGSPTFTSSSPPVVLVHGFGMSCDYFLPLAERLAVDRAVHMPDLPGHGRSDTPVQALDVPDKAQTLLEWMDGAGIGRVFLVGHSMGTQIAVEAVNRQPKRFAGLVLISPTPGRRASLAQHVWGLVRAAPFERLSLFGIMVRDYLRVGWRLLPECRAMMHDPVASKARRLSLPIMLIKGEHDAIVPADWLAYLAQATHAEEVLVIRGCGHAVHHRAPDEVANAMQDFLHRVASEGGPEGVKQRSKTAIEANGNGGRPVPPMNNQGS